MRLHAVEYEAFRIGGGTHYVPGLDAYLRFTTAETGPVTVSWSSVYLVVPSTARQTP